MAKFRPVDVCLSYGGVHNPQLGVGSADIINRNHREPSTGHL